MTAAAAPGGDAYAASRDCFEGLVGWIDGVEAAALDHDALERRLDAEGRRLLRQVFQDHLDARAAREQRVTVSDCHGITHGAVEADHRRGLTSIFGDVTVTRLAYRHAGHPNLHPADAVFNLPTERHSHGLRRLAATEASRGSFDDAVAAIERGCGQRLGKRQVEALALRAAVDFDDYYAQRAAPAPAPGDVLVISVDGKGIVMRPDALRPATAKAAITTKLATRLSKGEKPNRKRVATVGAVYHVTPVARGPCDILAGGDQPRAPAPVAAGKWLTAGVREDAAAVIARVFDEAERRDPDHVCPWVVLVDGNNHQIDVIRAQARARRVGVHIVVDYIHVLEYVWAAAWSLHDEGDPDAETWVQRHASRILGGHARRVAAAIRHQLAEQGVEPARAANAQRCADYLTNKARYLGYRIALAMGWPIATGVIEGACRHLIKDRMDITGARWGLDGAEAILKLRALRSNGDLDDYLRFHLAREQQRIHNTCYADGVIPTAA